MPTAKNNSEQRPAVWVRAIAGVFAMRRRVATALAIVFAVLLGYHVVFGNNGLTVYQQKRIENRELHKQIDALALENERMKQHVDHLKTDPKAIIQVARGKLHYTRPGDVIITLNDKPSPRPTPGSGQVK